MKVDQFSSILIDSDYLQNVMFSKSFKSALKFIKFIHFIQV